MLPPTLCIPHKTLPPYIMLFMLHVSFHIISTTYITVYDEKPILGSILLLCWLLTIVHTYVVDTINSLRAVITLLGSLPILGVKEYCLACCRLHSAMF